MRKLIIGISGASGFIYGLRLLEVLRDINEVETHLVISKAAQRTRELEVNLAHKEVLALADHVYAYQDIGAQIASGSFTTDGMIIAPCSTKTMAEIASGITPNLLSRAADVVLKERRRLVLMVRETPLHQGHLEAMLKISQMGGIIAPPVPAFYAQPQSLAAMVDHTIARVLDLFAIHLTSIRRWEGI